MRETKINKMACEKEKNIKWFVEEKRKLGENFVTIFIDRFNNIFYR